MVSPTASFLSLAKMSSITISSGAEKTRPLLILKASADLIKARGIDAKND